MLRFGLVGTGGWARSVHVPGLRAAAEPVAVWGRDPAKVAAIAEDEGLDGHTELAPFLDAVEAVAFAVPPHVQAELAPLAAAAGKHLLLEKPLATSVQAARAVEHAVHDAGVASVLFVTATYTPERRSWVEELSRSGPHQGAAGLFLSSALVPGGPFNTPWRHEKGALWDIGPHVLAALEGALGPVAEVATAARGVGDLVHLVLRHEAGATSAVTMTIGADPEARRADLVVWGRGSWSLPATTTSPVDAYATAVRELLEAARTGRPHRYDVSDGRRVVELLAQAEELTRR